MRHKIGLTEKWGRGKRDCSSPPPQFPFWRAMNGGTPPLGLLQGFFPLPETPVWAVGLRKGPGRHRFDFPESRDLVEESAGSSLPALRPSLLRSASGRREGLLGFVRYQSKC